MVQMAVPRSYWVGRQEFRTTALVEHIELKWCGMDAADSPANGYGEPSFTEEVKQGS